MVRTGKLKILWAVVLVTAAAAAMLPRAGQDPAFHRFVDSRGLLGVPNFGNVMSNIFFVGIGCWGFLELYKRQAPGGIKLIFAILFTGITLTGLGSAYYHWAPDNERLIWDRMPMTIVFMSVLALTVAEWVDRKTGVWLVVPLVALGVGSVLYWHVTEFSGKGDLRFYWWVQFFPMICIPLILILFGHSGGYQGLRSLVWVVIWYGVAKILEFLDGPIFTWTTVVSGHTLKHLAAAVSTGYLVGMFRERYADKPSFHTK
ncbi:ceramidase domain-containing protein [Dinghuibacter silviterrae]|uniref:Ceramidase n=1 Tax=Dinghuibacter silviterrae TaxID=1539049 RepID=A0A4V3GLZ4_9BACT|nr:ceramidase domain-containing protein [Dinghuibacter silviterrae]TDX01473.1 ceramidase [Dinghuibacter silviterrae]